MLTLKKGTRLIQTLKNKKNKQYTLMNTLINFDCTINKTGAKMIKMIYKCGSDKKLLKIINDNSEFVDTLKQAGIIVESQEKISNNKKVFISTKSPRLPLSCLNIELTNGCNLRCIHCYGKFGNKKKDVKFIDKEKLFSLIPSLNLLNCKAVSFTGGESTLHPEFLEIVEHFLLNGFEITIFTNGFNSDKIIKLVEKYPTYKFVFKISIDGFQETHDKIRGREGSYDSVIKLLDILSNYPDYDVYLSNTIMKSNIDQVKDFEGFILNKYPRFHYTKDLIFPLGNGLGESFNVNEFDCVYDKCQSLFMSPDSQEKKNRCSGGISQCTIMPNGKLKICNGACDPRFYFKNNAFEVGLINAWYDCGKNIKYYRNEKNKSTSKCKNCKMKANCTMTDCRIIALAYLGDEKKNSVITCYSTQKKQINK